MAKLERYEADTAVSDSEMIYTVGGAYYITPKTRIMLNYAHFSYEKSVSVNDEGGNLAASKIRNLECPSYEICLIDYGCGKFNRKIHIMEQYP